MNNELTRGPVMKTMLRFAVPMILGDLLQQCYNIADTLIVGRFLGADALAAVGSAFSLMTFLTSILLGLAMGSGTVFSIRYGERDYLGLKEGVLASLVLLGAGTLVGFPVLPPFIEPMTKNVMDPVSPTPVNASGPMVLPTKKVSAML